MKRVLVVSLLTALAVCAGGREAFSLETLTQNKFMTAESVDAGMTQTGIHFTLGEDYKSYYPEIRYGVGAMMEVGVKFGVTTADTGPTDKIGALVGADLKYQLVKVAEGIPVDMAVDLSFDNHLINSKNVSEVSFSTIISKGFPLTERGYKLTPYGGLEMAAIYGSFFSNDDTLVFVFGGLEWKISQKFMMLMELKVGDSTSGGVGIRFEY